MWKTSRELVIFGENQNNHKHLIPTVKHGAGGVTNNLGFEATGAGKFMKNNYVNNELHFIPECSWDKCKAFCPSD